MSHAVQDLGEEYPSWVQTEDMTLSDYEQLIISGEYRIEGTATLTLEDESVLAVL